MTNPLGNGDVCKSEILVTKSSNCIIDFQIYMKTMRSIEYVLVDTESTSVSTELQKGGSLFT